MVKEEWPHRSGPSEGGGAGKWHELENPVRESIGNIDNGPRISTIVEA